MKEISTPVTVTSVSEKEIKIEKPGRRALDFVRQFARVYQASRLPGLPGIVMNWQQHSRENTTLRRLDQAGAFFPAATSRHQYVNVEKLELTIKNLANSRDAIQCCLRKMHR